MSDIPEEFAETLLHRIAAREITFTEAVQAAAAVAGEPAPDRQECAAMLAAARAAEHHQAPPPPASAEDAAIDEAIAVAFGQRP